MKYKIGVFGSAMGDYEANLPKADELGQALGQNADNVIVITGACPGLPYAAAAAAAQKGAEVWGYSPNVDEASQLAEHPEDGLSIYKKVVYVPSDFVFANNPRVCKKYRNVISTANSDAGIIIGGQWGTLNEFTNLIDMQKVVGVLTGTGGAADGIVELSKAINKAGQGTVIFDDDPNRLVEKILDQLK